MNRPYSPQGNSPPASRGPGRRGCRRLLWTVLLCMAAPCGVPAADTPLGELLNLLFRNRRAAVQEAVEAAEMAVDVNAGAEFKPTLRGVLGRELHLVRKVCRPNEEQFAQIRAAGLAEVDTVARQMGAAQQSGRPFEQWPRPRQELSAALLAKVSELLPAEAAQAYRAEIEAREAAQRRAAQQMMFVIIDRRIMLLPDQYDPLAAALEKEWNDELSRNMQLYLYDEYLSLPETRVVAPVLNERQTKLYTARLNRQGRISFGWQRDLGLDELRIIPLDRDEFGTLGEEASQPVAEEGK